MVAWTSTVVADTADTNFHTSCTASLVPMCFIFNNILTTTIKIKLSKALFPVNSHKQAVYKNILNKSKTPSVGPKSKEQESPSANK